MKSAITVSLVSEARGGPFVFWDDLEDACKQSSELGFDAVELFLPGPDAIDPYALTKQLNNHNLQLAAVGTGAGWVKHKLTLSHHDADIRDNAKKFVRSMIDFAAINNAPVIIGSMQGRWDSDTSREGALKYLADSIEELATHAKQYDTTVIYEPLNRYETNLLTQIDESIAFIETLSATNVTLLADLFHMNIEEANLADAIRLAGKHVGHVHFADSNRSAAGMGHTDFVPIVQALQDDCLSRLPLCGSICEARFAGRSSGNHRQIPRTDSPKINLEKFPDKGMPLP